VLFFALLIAYPWPVLATGTIIYLASLPFGFMSYRNHQRREVVASAPQPGAVPAEASSQSAAPTTTPRPPTEPPPRERPARLN
jgi:CDP-diacylglycerol---serine O-phosphatidyltransferase